MASMYPYSRTEQQPVEQNSSKPTETEEQLRKEMAELRKEITEIKKLIERLSEKEEKKLNDNFEYLMDSISSQIIREIIKDISPAVAAQKQEIQKVDISINSLKKKVSFFFCLSGFKEFLFWTSLVCNVGIAGYLLYTLIDWSVIFG